MTDDRFEAVAAQYDTPLIVLEGLNEAVIGIGERFNQKPALIYDYEKCVEILTERDDMTEEEAMEFLDFNTINVHYSSEAANPIFRYPIRA